MPRVKETEHEKHRKLISSIIIGKMAFHGYTDKEMADRLRVAETTFRKRRRDPFLFPLDDVLKLVKILDLSEHEQNLILRGSESDKKYQNTRKDGFIQNVIANLYAMPEGEVLEYWNMLLSRQSAVGKW